LAACRISLDPFAAAARLSDWDAFTRSAVAKYVTLIEDDAGAYTSLRERLRGDRDLRVRIAAGYTGPLANGATVWTCSWCAHENDIAAEDCSNCDRGFRPTIGSD
jgi:hypothetical protein